MEQEHTGLYFYDSRPKCDLKRMHDITARAAAYEKTGPTAGKAVAATQHDWQVLVGAAADGPLAKPYRYTTNAPASDWATGSFNDQSWSSGLAPFGHALPGVQTAWNSGDIWLRQTFESDTAAIKAAALVIFYDEDTEVFVNGQSVWKRNGFTTTYDTFAVTESLRKVLNQGRNPLAVHTHQPAGGKFIDLALLCTPAETRLAEHGAR